MRSIHDKGPGSREELSRSKDELDIVLATARLGYCRLVRGAAHLSANSQFKAEFGWPPDAVIGWHDVEGQIHRDDRARLAEGLRAAFENAMELDVLVRSAVPNRGTQWVELRGRSLSMEDGPPELIIVARNVTDRHAQLEALEAQLGAERRLREAAESANRAKDEFLSVVSHELRSPLNAILGWNRILAIKKGGDPEVAAITPRIEQSAKAQLKMVNDLLDFGRIGAGKLKIMSRPMKLAMAAIAAIEAARPIAESKGVQLHYDFSAGRGDVHGDPERLQQVVANLLTNAIKFTPAGGRVDVSLRTYADRVELSVSDTGQGISPELLPRVFDRFRQGDASTTRHSGGLGLGLTLVKEIVALHGGTVRALSDGPGEGATFVISLPAAQTASSGARPREDRVERSATPPPLAGLSILVVDDELDARTVVAETLRLEGAEVVVTDSARAALDQLRAPGADFDVVVTDIGMPEEDGYSLVRKLRALSYGDRVLAIALTGYASRSDVEAAIDAGFDLHVPKPVDFDSFVPIIRRLSPSARSGVEPPRRLS
jgi:signal transduction histidine kinase/ActR/RegA family two-component response regulator